MWNKTKMYLLGLLGSHFLPSTSSTSSLSPPTTPPPLEYCDYDKFHNSRKGKDATKKLLLSPTSGSGGGGGGGSSAAIIQPDIYLCDKCENEFYSLKEVKAHERHCCGEVPSSPPTPSPEPEVPDEEPEPTGQVPFLSYFNLRPAQHTGLEPHMSPRKKSVSSPPAKLPGPIYPRYDTIALSSPLGRYLFAHSKFRSKYQASQHAVMRYERHLHATPNADINYRERCTSRWIVVWRSRKEQQPWVHLYCFNRAQRRERMITLRTGLTKESRRLLRLCRPLEVRVKRMPKRMVDRLLRLGTPNSAPCIDLTDEQQHLVVGQPLARPLDPPLTYWVSPGGSSLGHSTMELQWVTGLPEQSSTLAPHYASQLGTGNMVGLTVGHHSSLNLLSMVPGTMQHQHQLPPGLTIQPSPLSSRPLLPLAANNSHFKAPQNVPVEDGLGRLHFPLTPDVSISPIGGPAQPTRSQLEADFMKPLSRKKFPHLSSSPAVPQVSRQQARPPMAFPANQHLHPVPPQPPDWERVPRVGVGEGNSLPHTHPSSSIEVIDLSSDEDDYGRVGCSRSEAANAPQQLDGLACYPHTGAKVPSESSEYSLSKNGNSHWSSQQKSHCGAGRVGDLATNGQPPNVPPSPTIPHPCPDLGPSPNPSPEAHRPIENMRKRKIEEDVAPHGDKTIILDLCSQGMVVSKVNHSLSPTTSTSEHCDPPHKEHCRSGEVSTSSLPYPTINQTNLTSDTFSSLQVDQGLPSSQSGCVQRRGSEDAQGSSWKEGKPRIRFLNSLVNKGVEFFRSFMSKDSKALRVSTGTFAGSPRLGRGNRRRARARPASAKVSFEVQRLLRDECRELRRSGLRELSHLDPQGIRLTRRTVGHILPGTQPARKNLGPRLGENCPPNKNSSRAKKEEGRGGHREAMGWGPVSLKCPAFLTMDENGNSASYIQTDTKQPASRERPGLASRDESGWGVAAEAPRQWKVGAASLPSPVDKSETKFASGNVTGKSTVFSELSVRNSEVLVNSCSGARGNSVNNNLQYTQCTSTAGVVNSILTPTEVEAKKRNLSRDSVSATRRMNSFTRGMGHPVGVPTGKAAVGEKVTPGTLWDADNTTTSVCSIKTTTTPPPRLTKDVLSSSPTAVRPELTGKTAEECGAQLAQCPLPDQLQHYPASSDAPLTTHSRPHLTLLNSIRTSPASKHPVRPHSLDQQPPLYLSVSAKPQSTNQRKRAKLHRELINLGRDEYKEIRGTGFHPSDFLGHEEVKYLSTSSDEDEAPSPSTSFSRPQPARSAGGRAREPPQSTKVSREVARLLKDECKELQDRQSGKDKCDRDRERGRCRSMHPQAKLGHIVADDLEVWGSSRCSTRSQVNTQPVVETFTPRDSHRHLLRSEVAMCVLNYELPNIH
ncbi:uncharacterized protein LOC123501045 isoform X2 [Portunus trituberculatus]|uniref:uncharacterized protein LOC123501045 isoform X2 n=1 Tax=Portunus trituberculatus TaxID=210409 RepID=UPI001E1CE80D|nr:uncharacterized protein LOC123501045 isoform X2 [Portunus trituberculatus]